MKLGDAQARFCSWSRRARTWRRSPRALPAARAAVDELVVGDARLRRWTGSTSTRRMYFVRIHDVLRGGVAAHGGAAGRGGFHGLVTDYLQACPPTHPSLREAGARLPAFLATHACAAERPWLADLARLERARLEVFDGPDAAPLPLAALREVPPERFGALRLRLVPVAPPARQPIRDRGGLARGGSERVPPARRARDVDRLAPRGTVYHRVADGDEVRWLPRLADRGGRLVR